jgi:hypothetical protein
VNRIEWRLPIAFVYVTVLPLTGDSDDIYINRPAKPGLPSIQPIAADEARTAAPAEIDKTEEILYGCTTQAIFTGN